MADNEAVGTENLAREITQVAQRLDMLDQRLDNIDSVVSAVVERVMKQPATFNLTCTQCGHQIEIAIVGNQKAGPKG